MILIGVIAIVGVALRLGSDHEPAVEAVAAGGSGSDESGIPRVALRAADPNSQADPNSKSGIAKQADGRGAAGSVAAAKEEMPSEATKPVGREDDEIRRSLPKSSEAPVVAKAKTTPPTAASNKAAKTKSKSGDTKKRRTVAQWRSTLDRAKVLLDGQRWDAAAKILRQVSTEAPAREGAEARVLMRKLPPEFQPAEP